MPSTVCRIEPDPPMLSGPRVLRVWLTDREDAAIRAFTEVTAEVVGSHEQGSPRPDPEVALH